jgi:hypothetical protein
MNFGVVSEISQRTLQVAGAKFGDALFNYATRFQSRSSLGLTTADGWGSAGCPAPQATTKGMRMQSIDKVKKVFERCRNQSMALISCFCRRL